MNTAALIIGYVILSMVGLAILLFGFALGWFAIHEAKTVIHHRKWRKKLFNQDKYETARDCANYIRRWGLPSDMTIDEICDYFDTLTKMGV